jgi:thiol-disulfide isomerase/thioredoxin
MAIHRKLLGGALGLALAIVAAAGISGRNGFGESPDDDVLHVPEREPRMDRIRREGQMPELDGAAEWVNTVPLTRSALRGKVVVVDFWTYSCINWRRQLPYLRAWSERYADQGLVVIGVHSPEFEFEHATEGVKHAVRTMQIPYPVAIDSDHSVWDAFHNMYWPALYFIDAKGRIRHHQFGEGDYETSEMVIRQLLAEANHPVDGSLAVVDPHGVEAPADLRSLLTPENYIGYARTQGFRWPGGAVRDRRNEYVIPSTLNLAEWALAGTWTIGRESAVLDESGGRIVYRFHARDLHIVMGSRTSSPIRFRVRIDGNPPGDAHGIDVDGQGNGTINEPRLYQLIRQPGPVRDRELEIEFLDSGAEVFSFTFG